MTDKDIDFSDIPELDDEFWKKAKFKDRSKKSLSLMIRWFEKWRIHLLVFCVGLVLGGWLEFAFLVSWETFWNTLEKWQTLVGATGATFVGGISAFLIIEQLKQQREIATKEDLRHKLQRNSKARAAKALLPDAVASIDLFLKKCADYVAQYAGGKSPNLPEFPHVEIGVLKSGTEYFDAEVADYLMEIINRYQVHNARLPIEEGHLSEMTGCLEDSAIVQRMYDVAELHTMVGRLFNFVRSESDEFNLSKPSEADVVRAAGFLFHKFIFLGTGASDESDTWPVNETVWNEFKAYTKLIRG